MKQILLFCLVLSFSITSLAQYADTIKHSMATDYLKKSKKQKTTAWILLGGGTVMTLGSLVVLFVEGTGTAIDAVASGEGESTSSAGGIMFVTGIAAMAGSIPLFIASGKNRRKAAAAVSFKMENATIMQQWTVAVRHYPAVSLRFRL